MNLTVLIAVALVGVWLWQNREVIQPLIDKFYSDKDEDPRKHAELFASVRRLRHFAAEQSPERRAPMLAACDQFDQVLENY